MKLRTLALRHLFVHRGRAAMLLLGYGLGVGVMIVLLSIGTAMVDQSRDVALVGGGELMALPHGIDLESLRNGGITGMFFGVSGARFVTRQLLGGPRHRATVAAVAPILEQKAINLLAAGRTWPVRAGGEIPRVAGLAGARLDVVEGKWSDSRADSMWLSPDAQSLYDELDHFHEPPRADSAWAEWHYFNVVAGPAEWWYVTLLVGGDVRGGKWGGRVLLTHRTPAGTYERFTADVPGAAVRFDTMRADLDIGASRVVQRGGVYHVTVNAGAAAADFMLRPAPLQYFPAIDVGTPAQPSGYAVAALTGSASGRFCTRNACRVLVDAPAYHDHNWGTWRSVTWEWGAARGASHSILYGGVLASERSARDVPFVLGLEDSSGVAQVYRFESVERLGERAVPGMPGVMAPDSLRLIATAAADTLRVAIRIDEATGSISGTTGPGIVFLQMRGHWRASGSAGGVAVADSGSGFFETWIRTGNGPPPRRGRAGGALPGPRAR